MSATVSAAPPDPALGQIRAALDVYRRANPAARVDSYRAMPYSVRVRVIDPAFACLDPRQRHDRVWDTIEVAGLPADVLDVLTYLLTLAPDEVATHPFNVEFESPTPGKG